jgi:hypothetical protein
MASCEEGTKGPGTPMVPSIRYEKKNTKKIPKIRAGQGLLNGARIRAVALVDP